MATVTSLTADRMLEIEAASVIDGDVIGSNLILHTHGGDDIDAGSVIGPTGPSGAEHHPRQQGVLVAADGLLTRNSAVQVTIAAGSAWLKLSSGVLQFVTWSSTVLAVRNPASAALDQVVVDSSGTVSIQQGALGAGTTLDNRTGADDSGINANKLRLWDLNPTTANGGISATGFRDRRSWAYGARVEIVRNANGGAGNDYSSSSGSYAALDPTNLNPRVEFTGVPVKITLNACFGSASGGSAGHAIGIGADGSNPSWSALDVKTIYLYQDDIESAANAQVGANRRLLQWTAAAGGAGSHKIGLYFASDAVTSFVVVARAGVSLIYTIEEILIPSAANLAN